MKISSLIMPLQIPSNWYSFPLINKEIIVEVVNFNKTNYKNGIKNGSVSIKRLTEIFTVLKKIFLSNGNDIIYLSLSESTAGNIKDLLIYLICFRKHSNMIIHMLGGAGMKKILEKGNFQSTIHKIIYGN